MSSFFTETSSNSSITEPEDSGKTDKRWSIKAATPEEKQTLKALGFSDEEIETDPIPTFREECKAGAEKLGLTMGNFLTIVKLEFMTNQKLMMLRLIDDIYHYQLSVIEKHIDKMESVSVKEMNAAKYINWYSADYARLHNYGYRRIKNE